MEAWWENSNLPKKILAVIGFSVLGIGVLALFGLAVMALWNWLMTDLFGLKEITYLKALGLLALCTILFKSFPSSNESQSRKTEKKRKKKLRTYMNESEITDNSEEKKPEESV